MTRDETIEAIVDHVLRFNDFEDTASKRASPRYIHLDFTDTQLAELLAAWEKRSQERVN